MAKYLKIDFSKWKCRYSKFEKNLPNGVPGVYFFVHYKEINGKVRFLPLYIGSTKSLRSRLSSHEIYRELSKFIKDIECYYIETNDISFVEVSLIKKYKPDLNLQYNNDIHG